MTQRRIAAYAAGNVIHAFNAGQFSAASFGVGWLWHDPAHRSTVAAENLFGYDLLSLALNRRSEGE